MFGVIFGLVCYKLAENKGRDKNMGFLVGFLFGIFALLYYLCCGEMAECLHCKKRIKATARICHFCGKKI